ncbi:MAG: hypothetical protein HYV75_05245, partial [Opitutae bacterium]|nr:hypothetical protein [Opitutae bacterium]
FAKYGPGQSIAETRVRPSSGGLVAGKPVLITNDRNPAIVEIRNADTVSCTNTIYHRIQR